MASKRPSRWLRCWSHFCLFALTAGLATHKRFLSLFTGLVHWLVFDSWESLRLEIGLACQTRRFFKNSHVHAQVHALYYLSREPHCHLAPRSRKRRILLLKPEAALSNYYHLGSAVLRAPYPRILRPTSSVSLKAVPVPLRLPAGSASLSLPAWPQLLPPFRWSWV
jgi:hypothetical protein